MLFFFGPSIVRYLYKKFSLDEMDNQLIRREQFQNEWDSWFKKSSLSCRYIINHERHITSDYFKMEIQTPDWLNADFMRKVLKNFENDDSIEITDLTTEPAVEKGENYGSIMIRSKVKYSRGKSSTKTVEKKSLIIKISLILHGSHRELIEMIKPFEAEIKMMTTTLGKMNEILNEDNYRLGPRILYSEIGDPSLLVMEDLAPLGYRMANRQAGLDLDHCFLAIRGLAKFHASSVALYEKNPEEISSYNKGIYNADYPAHWPEYFTAVMKNIANEILEWSELGSRAKIYSEKLMKLSEVCYERTVKCARPRDNDFNVLNHGDCWLNNMLFRYNENGKVTDHIFVDFQICFWSSPAIDILNFLNTSINENVELDHRDAVLTEYLSTLTRIMKEINCETKPPTMADLERMLKERELYGILSSFVTLPFLLLDKNDAKSFEEMMQQNYTSDNPMYKGLAFRKVIMRRLPVWDASGSMDV